MFKIMFKVELHKIWLESGGWIFQNGLREHEVV